MGYLEPFWAAVTTYGEEALTSNDGRRVLPLEPGAFAWDEPLDWPTWHQAPRPQAQMVGLPRAVGLYLDHARDGRSIGSVIDWRDRPEALYGLVALDHPDENPQARLALSHVEHSCSSTFSVGQIIAEDIVGPLNGRTPCGMITKGALYEVSIATNYGLDPHARRLTDDEAERMLAGERLDLERVRFSLADKRQMVQA
jgi:hypothetical protein